MSIAFIKILGKLWIMKSTHLILQSNLLPLHFFQNGGDTQPCFTSHISIPNQTTHQPRHLHPISPMISRSLNAHVSASHVCKWSTDADLHEAVLDPANELH
jgi:hypothetical protein